jgi:hypothetical protein
MRMTVILRRENLETHMHDSWLQGHTDAGHANVTVVAKGLSNKFFTVIK